MAKKLPLTGGARIASFAREAPAPTAPEEPGWFAPGTASEALIPGLRQLRQAGRILGGGATSGEKAFGLGAAQGATAGFGEEASAALEALAQLSPGVFGGNEATAARALQRLAQLSSGRPLGEEMGGEGKEARRRGLTPGRIYREARGAMREDIRKAAKEQPWEFGGGQLFGGLATAPLVPAGATATTGRALGTAVGLGALGGIGAGEAEDLPGIAREAAVGGAVGGGLGLLGSGLSRVARGAGEKLREIGFAQARRVLRGGAQPLSVKKPVSEEALAQIIETGAMPPGTTTQEVAKRLAAQRRQLGNQLGNVINQLESAGVQPPSQAQLAARLRRLALEARRRGSGASAEVFDNAANDVMRATTATPGGRPRSYTLSEAERFKQTLQNEAMAEYERVGGSKLVGDARKAAAATINEAIEQSVFAQRARAEPAANAFRNLKRRFGNVAAAQEVAERGAVQAGQRQAIGLRDLLAAGAGGAIAGAPGAIALPAMMLARTRGTSAAARGALGLGRALEAVRRGPVGSALGAGEVAARRFLPGIAAQQASMPTAQAQEARTRALRRRRREENR